MRSITARNLPLLAAAIAEDRPGIAGFLRYREARFDPVTYRDWFARIERTAIALKSVGVGPGSRVLLMMETRYEWLICDLAILTLGAWTVPVYPNLPTMQLAHVVRDARPGVAIVSRPEPLRRLLSVESLGKRLRTAILVDGEAPPESPVEILSMGDLLSRTRIGNAEREELGRLRERIDRDDPATILYTSGTSATPKGVILTHESILSNGRMILETLQMKEGDRFLSILPLTHILERTTSYTAVSLGATIVYGRGIEVLSRDAALVRPTILVGVPRLFEKMIDVARTTARRRGRLASLLFEQAEKAACRRGRRGPGPLIGRDGRLRAFRGVDVLWNRLFYRRLREKLGGEVRMLVSGSAPLSKREAAFFCGVGLPLFEGYGLTEAGPVVSINRIDAWRAGSVGPPLRGVQVAIAEDGEILVNSPSLMAGYLNLDVETSEALGGGWLHTGDLGHMDADGILTIKGRKKELIVTSGGKNIAPVPIEEQLRHSRWISEAIVFGDRRPYLVALLVPDPEAVSEETGVATQNVLSDPSTRALLRKAIDRVNEDLAPHERIRNFTMLREPLSLEAGTLTPTLKIRRAALEALQADRISALYDRPRR